MPATLTAWRATPRFMRCRKRRLSIAGMRKLRMIFVFVSNSLRPFLTSPRCITATLWYRNFFTRLAPLETRIGQYWLQLPAVFGPRDLPALWQFLDALPATFTYGVEVRHPLFFDKGEDEQRLNRGLHERGVNRVILDSRPVHAAYPHSESVREAQRKKPKVPVHAVVTARHPMVRFIGSDNMAQNREFFAAWLQKLPQWRQTTTPFLFLHTPDIAQAPELVNTLWHDLRNVLPEIGAAPSIPQQSSLF
ncbi:Protein of uncharacterised function DUF72 [Salmonella enterica subsp. arizonae]|uniref:Protein of uncharacterized function DUF72 n=1 Tax=Salmonella enterica subsp. arizonae TaxID=59203 RepID=A0A379SND1_SALER|nr:Protein of uncharacterised function DUF72 [Salmonella enterica subsp. arizonae]